MCAICVVFVNKSKHVCVCFFFLPHHIVWLTIEQGVESNFVRYDRFKYRSRAQLQMIPADEPMTTTINFDAVTNNIRLNLADNPFTNSVFMIIHSI